MSTNAIMSLSNISFFWLLSSPDKTKVPCDSNRSKKRKTNSFNVLTLFDKLIACNLFLNENYSYQEVNDIIRAFIKISNYLS